MTKAVIDVSIIASWFIRSQATVQGDALLLRVDDFDFLAPLIFEAEVRNVLLVAERRGRIPPGEISTILGEVDGLEIEVRSSLSLPALNAILDLARTHSLTYYDALYLDLAIREDALLLSRDAELLDAARQLGVSAYDARD